MSLTTSFPNLTPANYRITSQADSSYNCIAWAAGVSDAWWWPDDNSYWPDSVTRSATIDSFTSAYQTLGYTVCDGRLYQDGVEQIAIYAKDGLPTHAARQLSNDLWTSKLGRDVDIEHPLVDGSESPPSPLEVNSTSAEEAGRKRGAEKNIRSRNVFFFLPPFFCQFLLETLPGG